VDFERRAIIVRDTKGDEDRVTMLPDSLIEPLKEHLQRVKRLHEEDLAKGYGAVYLPDALERKLSNASHEWLWQYVFPSDRLSVDPRTPPSPSGRGAGGEVRRHHLDESGLQRAVRQAAQRAGIDKRVTCHTFRQCAASFRTASPPTCSKPALSEAEGTAMTSAPSRSFSATKACPEPVEGT
jgi:integrase